MQKSLFLKITTLLLLACTLLPCFAFAQEGSEIIPDKHTVEKAVVVKIISETEKKIAIEQTPVKVQTIEVKITLKLFLI